MNDFIKDTTEIPSLSFGAPEPEPELPVQQPEEKKEVMDDSFPRKRWRTSEAKISGKSAICSPLL